MKKLLHKLHLFLGLASGLIIFIVAVSGCFVSFEDDLRKSFNAELYEVNNLSSSALSLDDIRTIAKNQVPNEKIQGLRVPQDETHSYEILLKGKRSIFIDQYTGEILGTLNKADDLFGKMLRLHRNLFLDETGEWITGISALIFLCLIISGIVLWWPRTKRNRIEKFKLKMNVHPIKRNYDLHTVLGFYVSWLILFTVLTGLIFSFKWAENTLFFATGSKKEKRTEVRSHAEPKEKILTLHSIFLQAKKEFPAFSDCYIGLPEDKTGSIRFSMRYENTGFFRRIDNLFYDQFDGSLIKVKAFEDLSIGTKLRITAENIHTGKSFGIVGQWVVFFASLVCASLPITGFLIWRNKRKTAK